MAYQQNLWDGAAEGYVKYNITPSFSTILGYNDTITISGQAYWRDDTIANITVDIADQLNYWENPKTAQIGEINKKISKGKTGTFSISCTIPKLWTERATIATGNLINGYITFGFSNSGGSGSETKPVSTQKFQILKTRVAPVIIDNSLNLSDNCLVRPEESSEEIPAYSYFNNKYIKDQSCPCISLNFTTDPEDSKLTTTHTLLIYNNLGEIVASTEGTAPVQNSQQPVPYLLELPPFTTAGIYNFIWRVTDSAGLSDVIRGELEVIDYFIPIIESFNLERYNIDLNDNLILDDSGIYLWVTLNGSVASVENKNYYTIELIYNEEMSPIQIRYRNDGDLFEYNRNSEILNGVEFDEKKDYIFTLTIQDMFNTIVRQQIVYKSGGYFNIEKNGVAVGQRSTGFPNTPAQIDEYTDEVLVPEAINKKFEVAEDYASHFYGPLYAEGGIVGVTTYPLLAAGQTVTEEQMTGGKWIDGKPIYRVVIFKTVTLADSTTVATMPAYETIVSCHCLAKIGSETKPVSYSYYNNNNWEINWTIQANGNIVMQAGSSHRVSARVQFIIEYTKTTD